MCDVFASLLWCLAWEAEVMLASVLGCSAVVFTLDAMVPGLGSRGDACFGARMLGMSSCAVFA
jgi:hypothetical protein